MTGPILSGIVTMDTVWICLGVGVVIGLIAVLIMKSNLRSVRYRSGAGEYVRSGSFHLTAAHDIFLYRTVTRVERPQNHKR